MAGLPADLLIAAVLIGVAAACLRAPVSRRVLVLLAIPVIPYAFLWQEKLAVDLFGQPGGGSAIIPSSIPLLYLPPLLLASLVLVRDLARPPPGRRAGSSGGLRDLRTRESRARLTQERGGGGAGHRRRWRRHHHLSSIGSRSLCGGAFTREMARGRHVFPILGNRHPRPFGKNIAERAGLSALPQSRS